MAALFDALREDHEKQRTLIELLTKTHGDSEGRDELFRKIKTELSAHAAAEERCLYVPMLERDKTQEKARHSIAEHKELDDFVEQLLATDYSSPAWLTKAKDLRERLLHHLDEEEEEMFPAAEKILSEDDLGELGKDYRSEMSRRREAA